MEAADVPRGAPVAEEPVTIREDQVVNAVQFLSHERVRSSPAASKRSFLEKKGLSAAEIDEAFRRAPEPPPAVVLPPSSAGAVATPATAAQPSLGPNNLVTYTGAVHQPHAAPAQQQQQQQQQLVAYQQHPGLQALQPLPPQQQAQQQPVRWTQAVLGLGVAAASLYGIHQLLAPRVAAWSSSLFAARKAAAEEDAARTTALTAALEGLATGQARLQATLEQLASTLAAQQQQSSAEATRGGGWDGGAFEVVPRSMLQQQERQQQLARGYGECSSASASGPGPAVRAPAPGAPRPDEAPRSAAFHEVMDLVRQGITPPNVRTDINDTPPDESRPYAAPTLEPRRKPWEQQLTLDARQPSAPNGSASEASAGFGGRLEPPAAARSRAQLPDLTGLLGGAEDAPWRPPPPPAPSVAAPRPDSSASSSSRQRPGEAAESQAVADVAAAAVHNVITAAGEG